MRTLIALTIPLLLFTTSAGTAPAKIRLPGHFVGLWCGEDGENYLPADGKRCPEGSPEWIVIDADGSYRGLGWGCRAIRVTIIDPGEVIKKGRGWRRATKGESGANAVYGVDARCKGKGDTWRERARIEAERWGSALNVTRRKSPG